MSKIEQKVMASVVVIYAVRRATSPFMLKMYTLVLSVVGIAAFVSLSHVTSNFMSAMQGGLPSIATFTATALLQTKFVVQLALVVGAAAVASLSIDVLRMQNRQPMPFVVG